MVMVSPVSRETLAAAGKQLQRQQRETTPRLHGSAQPYPELAQLTVGLHRHSCRLSTCRRVNRHLRVTLLGVFLKVFERFFAGSLKS